MRESEGKARVGAIAWLSVAAIAIVAWSSTGNLLPPKLAQRDARARLSADFGKMPLAFEANQGQTDSRVRFLARGSGYALFIARDEAVLSLRGPRVTNSHNLKSFGNSPRIVPGKTPKEAVLRMKLVGAMTVGRVIGRDQLKGKSNYITLKDPNSWHTNIPNFGEVEIEEVYPGIDLAYHGSNQRQLEYDFVVRPGGSADRIQIRFDGADSLHLAANGDLVIQTRAGDVIEHQPVVYQDDDSGRRKIDGAYVLRGRDEAEFRLGAYNRTKTVVIDPVLSYATFLGGSGDDVALAVASDSVGNAYVTGFTQSVDFPTTPNPYQASGGYSIFVTKLNSVGSALEYSTYLGDCSISLQGGFFQGEAIAVDSQGSAYVTGRTGAGCLPTTLGAFESQSFPPINNPSGGSNAEAFVTKLTPDGSGLAYSTYLYGAADISSCGFSPQYSYSQADDHGIAVDAAGNAYVAGYAASIPFPTTPGAFQGNTLKQCDNLDAAFVTKLSADGTGLLYSTLFFNVNSTVINGIAVDANGNAHVTGVTAPFGFPTTAGAFGGPAQACLTYDTNGNANGSIGAAGFATEFNSAGSALVFSSLLSGSGCDEQGQAIAVDSSGNTYVAGTTASTDFPTTPGAYQTTVASGADDLFIVKLDPDGAGLYSTYLGNLGVGGFFVPSGIAVDLAGNTFVGGSFANSAAMPTSPDTITPCFDLDAFVSELTPDGSALVSSSCILGVQGVLGSGFIYGFAHDLAGNSYFAGGSSSYFTGTTAGALQTANAGGEDALIFKTAVSPPSIISSGDTIADAVLGEPGFGPGGINDDKGILDVNASGFNFPQGIAIDISVNPNRLYVADSKNNRVLGWKSVPNFANGAAADVVIGQADFTSSVANPSGVSANSLNNPSDVAVDALGNLYVADTGNNRVLEYNSPFTTDTTADLVFGQGGNFGTNGTPSTISANTLTAPTSVAVDGLGNVFIVDGENRMLEYNTPLSTDTTADQVFGQPDFSSSSCSSGGPTANTLCNPSYAKLDVNGKLYIADNGFRVLVFNTPLTETSADIVIGSNGGGCADTFATTLCNPLGLTTDGAGDLYVSDSDNRVLEYDAPLTDGEAATRVFGQPDFSQNSPNNGAGLGAASLSNPQGLAFDGSGNLYVSDGGNNRVLMYQQPIALASPTPTATPTATPTTSMSVTGSLAFGNVSIGDTVTKNLTVHNTGRSHPLTVSSASPSDAEYVLSGTGTCGAIPITVAAEGSCTLGVAFTPNATGAHPATLLVSDNATTSPQHVTLGGTGIAGLTTTKSSLVFGDVKFGLKGVEAFAVVNHQTQQVSLSESFSGTNAGDFSITGGTCTTTLAALKSCSIIVSFAPGVLGTESASLSLSDSPDPLSPHLIPLSTGPTVPAAVTPATLAYGTLTSRTPTKTLKATVTNKSGFSLPLSESISGPNGIDFAMTVSGTCTATALPNSSCTIAVAFTPTGGGSPETASMAITIGSDPTSPHHISLTGTGP